MIFDIIVSDDNFKIYFIFVNLTFRREMIGFEGRKIIFCLVMLFLMQCDFIQTIYLLLFQKFFLFQNFI